MATPYQSWATIAQTAGIAALGTGWAYDGATATDWGVQSGTAYSYANGNPPVAYRTATGEAFAKGRVFAWAPNGEPGVVARYTNNSGQISYIMAFVGSGQVYLWWMENGSINQSTSKNHGITIPSGGLALALDVVNASDGKSVLCTVSIYDPGQVPGDAADALSPPSGALLGTPYQNQAISTTATVAGTSPLLGSGAPGMGAYYGGHDSAFFASVASSQLTVPTPSVNFTGITAAQLSVNATGGNGTLNYVWKRGGQVVGGNTATLVDTALAATPYLYTVTVTDSTSPTPQTVTTSAVMVTTASATALVPVFWGDSITYGTNTSTGHSASDAAAAALTAAGYTVVYNSQYNNQGISNSTSNSWHGTNDAVVQPKSVGIGANVCFIMLGTNDIAQDLAAGQTLPQTLTAYQTDLQAVIVSALSVPTMRAVMINQSIYCKDEAARPPSWFAALNGAIPGIVAAANTAANAAGYTGTAYVGDTTAFARFQANEAAVAAATTGAVEWFTNGEQIHPGDIGAAVLGGLWAAAYAPMNPLAPPPPPLVAAPLAAGTIGDAAFLRAIATGGKMPLTIQWYKGNATGFVPGTGNAVAGATNWVFTDPNLPANSTGYYRAIVTDAGGHTVTLPEIALSVGAIVTLPLATIKAIAGESFRLPWETL